MFYEIIRLLIDFVGVLFVGACLLRAWIQQCSLGPYNPLGQVAIKLSDWIVRPLRRIVPGYAGIDWASLIAAFVISLTAAMVFCFLLSTEGVQNALSPFTVSVLTLVWMLKWALYLANVLILINVLLSWINPFSPLLPLVDALCRPFLRPLRRLLPTLGRIDLSPLFCLLLIQIALIVLRGLSVAWLDGIY